MIKLSIITAINSLKANKSRTFLTVLGVVIGIFSVVFLVSVGKIAQNVIESSLSGLGTNLIVVIPGQRMGTFQAFPAPNFTIDQFNELTQYDFSTIDAFEFESTDSARVSYQNTSNTISVISMMGEWEKVRNVELSLGSMFTEKQIESLERVLILGSKASTDLFGDKYPIGETVKVNNIKFTVIGVRKEKGGGIAGDTDGAVFMPYQTFTKVVGSKNANRPIIYAHSKNSDESKLAKLELTTRMKAIRGINEGESDDFFVQTSAELLDIFTQVMSFFTMFLSAVAAISLIVGGIGIMNIMFVSVTERTKEIGLRKSLGAKRTDILSQFLIEAVVVTMLGGIIGIILALSLLFLIVTILKQPYIIAYDAVIYALLVSIFIGLIFGIYPAYKASLLNPIDALRSD